MTANEVKIARMQRMLRKIADCNDGELSQQYALIALGEAEPHTHTCQQCDKVVTQECECDEPVKMCWCSANCRAAFDL